MDIRHEQYRENLFLYRIYSYIAIIFYPAWGYLYQIIDPAAFNPIDQRVFISIFFFGLLATSYLSKTFKENIVLGIYLLATTYTAHYTYITYHNEISAKNVVGLGILILGSTAAMRSIRSFYVYAAVVLVCNLSLLEVESPKFSIAYVFASSGMMMIAAGSIALAREKLINRLHKEEGIIRALISGLSGTTGDTLYEKSVTSLTANLGVKEAFIAKYDKQERELTTIAVSSHGGLETNFTFPIEDTPCEEVVEGTTKIVPDYLQKEFDKVTFFSTINAKSYIGAPLLSEENTPLGVLVIVDDKKISDPLFLKKVLDIYSVRLAVELDRQSKDEQLKTQQARAVENARLASLGEMAGGIAHEINNPLFIIRSAADLVALQLDSNHLDEIKIRKALSKISDTTDRIATIINGLRTISRESSDDGFEPASIRTIMKNTLALCATRFRNHGIDLTIDLPEDEYVAECRPVQIGQVLINLMNNALHALKDEESPWAHVRTSKDKEFIYIDVIDNGHGVPSEVRAKIFNPFFTTKDVGVGTGLGLSISKGIMDSHNGALELVDGNHTNFRIKIPWSQVGASRSNSDTDSLKESA